MPIIDSATQLPGESSLQYMLRQGVSPNDASAQLMTGATANVAPSAPDMVAAVKKRRAAIDIGLAHAGLARDAKIDVAQRTRIVAHP